jgi:hypothetical protein
MTDIKNIAPPTGDVLINLLRESGSILGNDAANALEAQARQIEHLHNDMKFMDGKNDELRALLETDRDTIDELRARIAELEAALRPFTDVESIVPFFHDAGWGLYAHVVTKRDMEAARAALEKK